MNFKYFGFVATGSNGILTETNEKSASDNHTAYEL